MHSRFKKTTQMSCRTHRCSIITLIILLTLPASATDWPQWRGPFFNGSTDEENLPASWSRTENIAWIAPLPGPSGATPIISNGRVLVTSMDRGTKDFVALCFDQKTGRQLWQAKLGGRGPWRASLTPASPSVPPTTSIVSASNPEVAL